VSPLHYPQHQQYSPEAIENICSSRRTEKRGRVVPSVQKKNLTRAWPFLWRISPAKMRSSTLSKRGFSWFDHWIFDLRLQKFLQFWLENCGKMMIEHEKIRGTTFFLINHHWESSFLIDVPLLLYQYFPMIYKSGYINHKHHKWYTSYFSMYHFCISESPFLMWKSTINGSFSIAILT
jgi:hypothetical protein